MKKFAHLLVLTLGIMVMTSSLVLADGVKFTPLNFDDTPKSGVKTTSSTVSGLETKSTDLLDPAQVTGGSKMQSAILQIDNAQVEVRNKLLNYRTEYAEIDTRYNNVKAERKAAKKQIKLAEKKIKNLDRAKNKIRKNFERKNNV